MLNINYTNHIKPCQKRITKAFLCKAHIQLVNAKLNNNNHHHPPQWHQSPSWLCLCTCSICMFPLVQQQPPRQNNAEQPNEHKWHSCLSSSTSKCLLHSHIFQCIDKFSNCIFVNICIFLQLKKKEIRSHWSFIGFEEQWNTIKTSEYFIHPLMSFC